MNAPFQAAPAPPAGSETPARPRGVAGDLPSGSPMGVDPIGVLLWRFSPPAVVGMMVNALYNVVDRLYIGQGVGRDAMAGLTLTLPYMMVMAAFGMLIGVGSGAVVSLRLGAGRKDEAEQALGQALAMIGVLVLAVPTLAMLTLDRTLRAFGGTDASIPYAREYLRIMLYGNVFTHLSFGMNHLMRSEGSARRAMVAMVLGALANILLDPLFIFGFGWGIRGAAWATVLSMMFSTWLALRHFRGPHSTLRLRWSNVRIRPRLARQALAIGASPFAMQLVAGLVMVSYTRSLRLHAATPLEAVDATAAIGIVMGVALLLLMPVFGLVAGAQPIFGFNYGAGRFDRVRQAFRLVVWAALAWSTVGWALVQLGAPWIVRAFTREPSLQAMGVPVLRRMILAYPLIVLPILATTYFQSVGKPRWSILLGLIRQAIVLIPLIFLLPVWFGLSGIWLAAPLSDLVAVGVTVPLLLMEWRALAGRTAATPGAQEDPP